MVPATTAISDLTLSPLPSFLDATTIPPADGQPAVTAIAPTPTTLQGHPDMPPPLPSPVSWAAMPPSPPLTVSPHGASRKGDGPHPSFILQG